MNLLAMIVYGIGLSVSVLTGMFAGIADFRGMKIPNLYSLIIAVCFFAGFLALELAGSNTVFHSFWSHFLGGLILFLLTYLLYALGAFGAGDSKLLTAYGFWFGLQGLPVFIFYVTIIGAVLAFAALVIMRIPVFANMPEGSWIARLKARERVVPYGVAISLGAIIAFCVLGNFSALSSLT